MKIKEYTHNGYITLEPEGDLDANSSVYLDEKIRNLIDQGASNFHIDFRLIPYISSPGLGVFISYLDELNQKGGKFVLSHLSESVQEVFTLLGLHQLDNLILMQDDTEIGAYFKQ